MDADSVINFLKLLKNVLFIYSYFFNAVFKYVFLFPSLIFHSIIVSFISHILIAFFICPTVKTFILLVIF